MILSFRQGIVQYEAEGFLESSPSAVSLVVNDTPTVVSFANHTSNYIYVEHRSVPNAWPIMPGVDQWLYWDIHTFTAERTFGVTYAAPVVASSGPSAPVIDQHWYDTTTHVMKVWSGERWAEKIRTFACKVSVGSVISSVSINSPIFSGTQVGDLTDTAAGYILFDTISSKPLKVGNRFITTEDVLATSPLTKSDVKTAAIFLQAVAEQPMARYTVVEFSDFGKVVHTTALAATDEYRPLGIIQQDCVPGDIVTVTTSGIITSYDWNWTALGINTPLYCDDAGALTHTPRFNTQRPIGYVIDTNSIMVSGTSGSATQSSQVKVLTDLDDVTITTPATDNVLKYNGTQWVNAVDGSIGYRQLFTATAGQTVFGPLTNAYTVGAGQLSVYINGSKQYPNTYIETSTTSFTLTSPSDVGDIILVEISKITPPYIYPTSVLSLDGLTDVTIATPTPYQVVTYNGTQWVNMSLNAIQVITAGSGGPN